MLRIKNNIIVAIALFTVKCAVANVVTNSFIIAQGNGVSVSRDGSIIHDKRANDDITVRARSGWLVNGRDSVSLSASRGGMLKVMSRLGEDEEHVHVYPSETKDVHSSDIILGVLPKSDNLIAMYALPDTSTVVSISAMLEVTKRGKHKETTTYYPCVCGETHNPQEVVRIYEVEPDGYEWTASGAGQTVKASTWTGQISKGLRKSIEFTVVGKRDDCASCMCIASTNVVVDVHELSVTNDLYLGLDRTDFGRTNPVVKVAGALIDPEPTGSSAYSWIECGICSFTGRTDQAQVRYFASDPDKASTSYLAEPLTVCGTATNAEGLSVSANCTTNFTVVKVDVTIGGVDEEKEEDEGAFVQHVADTNGLMTVEGTNKMIAVTFSCEPTDLPTNEVVTITSSGPGELYEALTGGELVLITTTNYPACELSGRQFKLHGHGDSSALRDGVVRIDHATSGAKDVAEYTSFSVQFITPAGDPIRAPKDVGDGQNEFTFSTANPGVLTMNLKARVTPAAAAPIMAADCHFEVGAVGTSAMAWAAANPRGKAICNGGFLTATVAFTGLPDKNVAFGKKAILLLNGRMLDENDYEVFFPKNATNHPCTLLNSNWPNWMFYWLQTVEPLGSPAPDFVYGTSSYFTPGTKIIVLSDGDAGSYDAPYGANNTLCGIDNFAWTVIHESQHYKDWQDFWANNVSNHRSHVGGVELCDDKDGDSIPNGIEDANQNGIYEPSIDLYDWQQYNTPTPHRPSTIINDFEDWNCQRHKNVKGDHSKDWGDPGMQHKTRDKYND